MHKFLILLFLASCGIDRTTNSISSAEASILKDFENLDHKHQTLIAGRDEPGKRLTLCLSYIDKSNGEPVSNRKVHFYHTDMNGEYMPKIANDESTARLNGSALTDSNGKILLRTILPGDYGSSADNRHIHTTVFDAQPEAYDIHFKQYTGAMGKRFIEDSDQHFLADLKRNSDGSLIGFLTIKVKNP